MSDAAISPVSAVSPSTKADPNATKKLASDTAKAKLAAASVKTANATLAADEKAKALATTIAKDQALVAKDIAASTKAAAAVATDKRAVNVTA